MIRRPLALLLLFMLSLLSAPLTFGVTGNAWHIPDDNHDVDADTSGSSNFVYMRDPRSDFALGAGTNTALNFYQAVYKGGGDNETGGTFWYRAVPVSGSPGPWQSVSLNFFSDEYSTSPNFRQIWNATLNSSNFGVDDAIQYYFEVTFGNRDTTFLYGNDADPAPGSQLRSTVRGDAELNPYSVHNRPAFLFHASNRVINGTSVQFWTKAGYLSKDTTRNWATNGAIYYTTNGATPAGSLGVAGANTTTLLLSLDHAENDPSVAGNATWWVGTATNLPTFTNIQYKIGLWNSGNNEEKFADYSAPSDTSAGHVFSFSLGTVGAPSLTVNGVEANYTTSHLFVDEIAGDLIPLTVNFTPNTANVDSTTVQVFTNLNRRDYATLPYTDGNGLATEEGISPPSGDVVGTDDSHYYKAIPMSSAGVSQYTVTLNAQKTGAYRLSARYRLNSSSTWIYYSSGGRRDHAIVVSPKDARNINLYEVNTLNINATGDQAAQRSTFADLHNNAKRFNLDYLQNLGCNYLWFQPIHPNGIDGRQIDPDTGLPFTVGSPYAVKNFFAVMELMGAANTRSGALSEFQGFVTAADTAGVGVMLDAPFNHTSYDAELAQQGVDLFKPGAGATDQIRNSEARFYSRGDLFNFGNNNYCSRASGSGNIAPAPDRNDFGKFGDTFDVFYGQYSALVCLNNQDNGNYLNESDVFNYSDPNWNGTDFVASGINNNITRNVWRYFASYIPFWIVQTGHSGSNSTPADGDPTIRRALDSKGIDALRADFGQGLPPQCWEYIINVARSHKWNFVFMTESLDGGAVTYRSNRHFDILNENIVFPFKTASTTQDYRNIFDQRRSAYGQGLVLLNNTSHDEENYNDPYEALIRYGVSNTIDGAPLIFYGQENGVSRTFGYSHYETNFGKQITHFKVFNDLGPILGNTDFGLQQLYPVYAAMGQARQFSTALRSSNRYYLNQIGDSIQPSIFSVAKYDSPNSSPVLTDVVFAFMNLDRNNDQSGNFNVNIPQSGTNLFGIKRGRTYDVRNIAAYTAIDPNRRTYFLNRETGDQLLDNGFFVSLKKVPATNGAWATGPFEAQYLKLYDVSAPTGTPGSANPGNAYSYVLGNAASVSWAAAPADSEGIVPSYRVSVTSNGITTVFFTSATTLSFPVMIGQTYTVTVQAVNPSDNGVGGPMSTQSNFTVLSPSGDQDGDGMTNAQEDAAGTNPLDANSIFRVTGVSRPDANHVSVTWSSVIGKQYLVQSAGSPGGSYVDVSGSLISANTTSTSETLSSSMTGPYYRVRLGP